MYEIGFIGGGNMGNAMMKGLLSKEAKDNIIFTDKMEETRKRVSNDLGISCAETNIDVVKNSKYIITAIKPQFYMDVLLEIKPYLSSDNIVISIAPGFPIKKIKEILGDDIRIVRAMPNTPALVKAGMSVISFSNDLFQDSEKDYVKNIFNSFGRVEVLEEGYIDAVVPIAGSSPAYVYMMIEAMADAGVLAGLPRKSAYEFAAQSVLGAAKMVLETGIHPGELKDAVCSPGGTTIEAVAVLEKSNFRNAIIQAMSSCYEKTKKMC